MGWTGNRYKWIGCVIFTLGAPSAHALEGRLDWVGRYAFSWDSIPLGSVELQVKETPDSYHMRLAVHSQGLVNLFTHHVSDTTVDGRRSGDMYHPLHYESHYKTKEKPRYINLTFNGMGAVTEETVVPPEDRRFRPEVPHALKDGAYDPLTALMEIRAGRTGFRGFDARHLYQVKVMPQGSTPVGAAGKAQPALLFLLSRTPLAGLTGKETADFARGEPPLALLLSDDARRIPVRVSVPLFLGNVRGVLVQECRTWDECALH